MPRLYLAPDARDGFIAGTCAASETYRGSAGAGSRYTEGGLFHGRLTALPCNRSGMARLKPEKEGDRIGRYKLLQKIGEGGFGTVYMAEQEEPVSAAWR